MNKKNELGVVFAQVAAAARRAHSTAARVDDLLVVARGLGCGVDDDAEAARVWASDAAEAARYAAAVAFDRAPVVYGREGERAARLACLETCRVRAERAATTCAETEASLGRYITAAQRRAARAAPLRAPLHAVSAMHRRSA